MTSDAPVAGAGQEVLQADAGDPLVGAVLGAKAAFAARDTGHFVRLVEHDHAVMVVTDPFEDLLEPRTLVTAVGAQRGVGEEQDAFDGTNRGAKLPLVEMLNVERETADRGPVATCILEQRFGLRDPDVLAATAQPLVENDGGDLAAFAGPGAVTEEETGAIGAAFFVGGEREALFNGFEQAGDIALESIAGIDQRLELSVRERLRVDDGLREGRDVGRPRGGDRAHGNRFHQRGR